MRSRGAISTRCSNACHPDVVLRPHRETSERTGREAPYRGHEGVRAYVRDIGDVWKSLKLTPTTFRPADGSVIVFGRAETNSGAETKTLDVLWVWRLRDGLVASVEVFQSRAARPATTRPNLHLPAGAPHRTLAAGPDGGRLTRPSRRSPRSSGGRCGRAAAPRRSR